MVVVTQILIYSSTYHNVYFGTLFCYVCYAAWIMGVLLVGLRLRKKGLSNKLSFPMFSLSENQNATIRPCSRKRKSSENSTKPDIFESHICIKHRLAVYDLCSRKNLGYFLREHALMLITQLVELVCFPKNNNGKTRFVSGKVKDIPCNQALDVII